MLAQIEKLLLRYQVWLTTAFVIACCLASTYLSSRALVFNADTTSNIFLFKPPLHLHDILLADYHTNLLKAPILFLEALFPTSLAAFVLFNSLVVIATILGWAYYINRIFGKQYFVPVAIVLSLITLGAFRFALEISYITIRNIEYPIWLYLIHIFYVLFRAKADRMLFTKRLALYLTLGSILIVSDQFFAMVLTAPPLAMLYLMYRRGTFKVSVESLKTPAILILGPVILAHILLFMFKIIGLYLYSGPQLKPAIYGFFSMPMSFMQAMYNLMQFFNGDMFNRVIALSSVPYYVGFTVFATCVVLYVTFWKHFRKLKNLSDEASFTAQVLWVTALIIFIVYILTYSIDIQTRYLTLIVFILPTLALVLTLQRIQVRMRAITFAVPVLCTILVAGLLYGTIVNYRLLNTFSYYQYRHSAEAIVRVLNEHHITTIATSDQYAVAIKFWSGGKIDIIPVAGCNQRLPYLVRRSWYEVRPKTFAYIQDSKGTGSLACSTKQSLQKVYGEPLEHYTAPSFDPGNTLDIYTLKGSGLKNLTDLNK